MSTYLAYDTYALMTLNTTSPAGTYAQVFNDSNPANNLTYEINGAGVWSPSGSIDAPVVQVTDVFSIGTISRHLDQYIAAGEVHLQGTGVAWCDGSHDDAASINSLAAEMSGIGSTDGGGKIKFERTPSSTSFYKLGKR